VFAIVALLFIGAEGFVDVALNLLPASASEEHRLSAVYGHFAS
jgi:hypothetical protein